MSQPFAAVFYDVSTLPGWMQHIAWAMPPAYVFEGMRKCLADDSAPWEYVIKAATLNVCYLAIAGWFFARTLTNVREKGLLTKVSTS
jgi:ABC-2 type transport system permease protein